MTWTLLVRSHGRWEYLERCLASLDLSRFARKILAVDGQSSVPVDAESGWLLCVSPDRRGLTANLQQAWDALGPDEWVFDVEEDFLIHDAPLDEMRLMLEQHPQVANMVLCRQPVNPREEQLGVLGAQPPTFTFHDGWVEHRNGFWLNPHVMHSSVAKTYPAGVESELTEKMLVDGRTFGYWGAMSDEPRCTHIGDEGGMWSEGWLT